LRVRDGQALTLTAPARNTAGYLTLLQAAAAANPDGELHVITDNLASHKSPPIQAWLNANPRVHQVFLPTGACWLNLIEAWWRLFRREALAGQSFATGEDIAAGTCAATRRLNGRAKPWVWGRPPRHRRRYRRHFVYRL
jgi:transposase